MTPPKSGTMREQLERLRPDIREVSVFGRDMSLEEREKAIKFLEESREDDVSHEAVISEASREAMSTLQTEGGKRVTLVASDGGVQIEAWYDGEVNKFFMRFPEQGKVRSYQPKRFGAFLDKTLGTSLKIDAQKADTAGGVTSDSVRKQKDYPLKQMRVDAAESRSNSGGRGAIAAENDTEIKSTARRRRAKSLLATEIAAPKKEAVAAKEVSDVVQEIEPVPADESVKVGEPTDDFIEAVVTVKQGVSGEDVLSDGEKTKEGGTDEKDESSIERPSLKEKIFGSDWDERRQKESAEALEELRRRVGEARLDYAAMDYKKTGMMDSVKRFFPFVKDLSKDKDEEILAMRNAYQSAVTEYKNARLNALEGARLSQAELKRELVGVLKEIELDEQVSLYNARIEAKLPDWMADGARKAVDWYRGLSFQDRLLLSGALMAGGAAAGVSFGAAAASAWFMARRAFGGAVAGRGVFQFTETLDQKKFQEKTEEKIRIQEDLIQEGSVEEMLRTVQGRLNFSIEHSDERLNEMMKHRTRNTVAGFATGLFLGSGMPSFLMEKLHSFGIEPFEGVGDKVKEGAGSVMEKVRETSGMAYRNVSDFLHTYTSLGEAIPTSERILEDTGKDLTQISLPRDITEAAIETSAIQEVAAGAAGASSSDMHTRAFESVVNRGSSVIGSLHKLDDLSAAPKVMWDKFVEASKDNPFFVKEKFTMPGAQVMVEGDKIVDIVDKQGVLFGVMRDLSEGRPSAWRAIKDMTLDQMRTNSNPELYSNTIESMAKYQNFLGDDMPSLRTDQSVKTWVAEITKAYFKKKGW